MKNMKQRKFIQLMFILLLPFVGISCEKEVVSGLDNSVDARINEIINGYVDELKSSEYGWMASIGTSEGYYRFHMTFQDDNKVVMFTDNPEYPGFDVIPDSSTYAFKALQRPTLIFDTYSYMHLINDPNADISGGSNTQGLYTDFEFEVEKYEDGIFYMAGRFNKVKAIFKKASKEDKAGVEEGLMMQLPEQVQQKMANKYIKYTAENGVEIAIKVVNNRSLYSFWFNDKTGMGEDSQKYYNAEVDGSGDLFFPEPISTGPVSVTGLKYDKNKEQFTDFYTSENKLVEATVSNDPPSLPLSKIFGYAGDGKMFEGLVCPPGLTSSLPAGDAKDALGLQLKFAVQKILCIGYDVHYTFVRTVSGPEFQIYILPVAIGLDIYEGKTLTTSYPAATYGFPVTYSDDNYLTFSTSKTVRMRGGAQIYYDLNIMTQLVDLFTDKTFEIRWSNVGASTGLIIQLVSQSDGFAPPAILQQH
ncbi:MAG: hypothetical protein EZS26_000697 [Candidatus Ordinivivax streblomastigis]|uniref:DUF4302 domain-containing protein n=1 Tax=Candidatus Ordinivivax streblomastigis TaxID=2540710 RepID=A0A5M8P3Y3_9BACT|nr:MAG: hypothetical protein EZS26_000697 [Candidatus Ordinivivax streblomastigis]